MPLNRSSLKGLRLLTQEKVIPELSTPNYIFFDVDGEKVTYDIRKDLWTCGCRHEVYRGNNLSSICYHIKAAKYYFKRKREQNDKDTNK